MKRRKNYIHHSKQYRFLNTAYKNIYIHICMNQGTWRKKSKERWEEKDKKEEKRAQESNKENKKERKKNHIGAYRLPMIHGCTCKTGSTLAFIKQPSASMDKYIPNFDKWKQGLVFRPLSKSSPLFCICISCYYQITKNLRITIILLLLNQKEII